MREDEPDTYEIVIERRKFWRLYADGTRTQITMRPLHNYSSVMEFSRRNRDKKEKGWAS